MALVYWASPTANMYGCEPCPRCGSVHRASYRDSKAAKQCGHPVIECDCGLVEPAEYRDEEGGEE